jgi:hypothetical protein
MTELVSLKDVPKVLRIMLLKELGFNSDGTYVLYENGEKYLDKYIQAPIRIDNMAILPGSTIILDNNPLSISSFLEEYGDVI